MSPVGRPLLVLDLDEAIWHGVAGPSMSQGVSFLLRPLLQEFLETVSLTYDLAVWTAASEDWMRAGLEAVRRDTGFDLEGRSVFTWHRSRCTLRRNPAGEYVLVKHARKFGTGWLRARYPKDRILVLDDQPRNYASGYGHLVRIGEWRGDLADTELAVLAFYLVSIAGEPNLRRLEKRGWRSRAVLPHP